MTSEADIKTNIFTDKFITMNLVQNQDYFNVRYQIKPFMIWIWISVLLISFGGAISLFRRKMKIKIYHVMITIFFLILFFIFYKGLKNSNIYTPNLSIKKDIPIFEAKLFDSNNFISSKKIFKENKFYIMNIWASWCVPCRDGTSFFIRIK